MDMSSEKVYVAGHTGLLGKSVHKLFSEYGFDLEAKDSSELDLRNSDQVFDFISKYTPPNLYNTQYLKKSAFIAP